MKLLLLGPVGSGKGTLSAIISKNYNIPHISIGELFRTNIQNNTELGIQAKKYMDKGLLVPETLTNKLVKDRLKNTDCKNGFILDGYPRNIEQAHALDKITELDKVVYINISENEIMERLYNRRICKECKQPTSINWLVDGKCEKCGGEVYIRNDDKPDVIKVRIKTNKVSDELKQFYKDKGIFNQINATNSITDNYELIDAVLKI